MNKDIVIKEKNLSGDKILIVKKESGIKDIYLSCIYNGHYRDDYKNPDKVHIERSISVEKLINGRFINIGTARFSDNQHNGESVIRFIEKMEKKHHYKSYTEKMTKSFKNMERRKTAVMEFKNGKEYKEYNQKYSKEMISYANELFV